MIELLHKKCIKDDTGNIYGESFPSNHEIFYKINEIIEALNLLEEKQVEL